MPMLCVRNGGEVNGAFLTSLVGLCSKGAAVIYGGATPLQRYGFCGAAVVLQAVGVEHGIQSDPTRNTGLGIHARFEHAAAIRVEVVAAVGDRSVRPDYNSAETIAVATSAIVRKDRVPYCSRARVACE